MIWELNVRWQLLPPASPVGIPRLRASPAAAKPRGCAVNWGVGMSSSATCTLTTTLTTKAHEVHVRALVRVARAAQPSLLDLALDAEFQICCALLSRQADTLSPVQVVISTLISPCDSRLPTS